MKSVILLLSILINSESLLSDYLIGKAFWQRWDFWILIVCFFAGALYTIINLRIKNIQLKKNELEQLVKLKTAEVQKQNSEILEQNAMLEQQKEEIKVQADNLKCAYENLALLNEIGLDITTNLSVKKIIETVYVNLNALMDASVFGIGIYNEENNSIDFQGVIEKGSKIDLLSISLDDEQRLSTYCLKKQAEIFINNFQQEYRFYFPDIRPSRIQKDASSIIYVPLGTSDKYNGVITVQSYKKNAYSIYHKNLVRSIAMYTNVALENAHAFQEIAKQTENLTHANQSITLQRQEIAEKNAELVILNEEKNQLISILAHDLRNPLATSITIAEMLKSEGENLTEEQLENVEFLRDALKRMNKMINKILDVKAIEAKDMNIKFTNTNIEKILSGINSRFETNLQKKKIKISLENQAEKSFAYVDKNYTTQIFENLISNAIKFSPQKTRIQVRIIDKDERLRIEIRDEGPGFTANDLKKIFGKYQQLSAKPTDNEKSTGLGLFIVKKYVDEMKGMVWVENNKEKGATFYLEFNKEEH